MRLEHALLNRRLPHRLLQFHLQPPGSLERYTNTRHRIKAHDLAEICSTWAATTWPRPVRRERLQRVGDREVLGKSCTQQPLTRASRAVNGEPRPVMGVVTTAYTDIQGILGVVVADYSRWLQKNNMIAQMLLLMAESVLQGGSSGSSLARTHAMCHR